MLNLKQELNLLQENKFQIIPVLFVAVVIAWMALTTEAKASTSQIHFGDYLLETVSEYEASEWTIVDLDKLAYAVSCAETSCGTRGTAITYNNMFGIMSWTSGRRKPKAYKTKADSTQDFKRIWAKYYKTFPTLRMAEKWTGKDNSKDWLRIVKFYYNQ